MNDGRKKPVMIEEMSRSASERIVKVFFLALRAVFPGRTPDESQRPDMVSDIAELITEEFKPIKQLVAEQNHEIEQILGKALGYPKYVDDQKNFPDATGDEVCVGEHTAETIATEAAAKIEKLKAMSVITHVIEVEKQRDKLQAFKDYVHKWLDDNDVPHDPAPEQNRETGCRIEGRLNWLNNRVHQTSPDRPLEVNVEGDELVIRIGVNTLQHATEHCERLRDHRDRKHDFGGPYVEVVSSHVLADDVRGALNHEEEDGTTPVHVLFDDAVEAAFEDGSLAFAEGK